MDNKVNKRQWNALTLKQEKHMMKTLTPTAGEDYPYITFKIFFNKKIKTNNNTNNEPILQRVSNKTI